VVIARDPEHGMNSGVYRFMLKERALTGIDIVTPNNMRLFAQRAYEAGRPCPISISIGTHPMEIMGAGYRAPIGMDEMAITGGIRGAAGRARAVRNHRPAVRGRRGDRARGGDPARPGGRSPRAASASSPGLMGGLHWNPNVRVKAVLMRRDAVYYALHMPWENTWLAAPTRYQAIRRALRTAGVQVKDINVTLGGRAFWHAVISIRKQAGEGKNALLAALSVMDLKHVVVVDDDIDVFDPTEVEWAIATRVQADRDVMIVTHARGKPLDPSLAPTPPGVVPTTAKVGIDATIAEGIPRERYERISYAYADRARIAIILPARRTPAKPAGPDAAAELARKILGLIDKTPLTTPSSPDKFSGYDFQTVARALGSLHAEQKLWQDAKGRICVRGSPFAAKP
jgi:2,5-furandicarboxylate decarboxylase 1